MISIADVPHRVEIIYDDSDFDKFIEAWVGKPWSIQQSLLDCDNQAGNGVLNSFEADFWPDSKYWLKDVLAVEAWRTAPNKHEYHCQGRWEDEGVATHQIFSWLCARGALPEGDYQIRNYW